MKISYTLRAIVFFVSIFCFAKSVCALDVKDLLFYASFERGVNADIAKGNGNAKQFGTVKLVPGHNGGQAVEFTSKGDYINYLAANNVNMPQGTVCFWLRELNTLPDQRILNPYFRLLGVGEVFEVSRLWQPIVIAGGQWRDGKKVEFTSCPVAEKDKWCHIAFAWRNHELMIYVNGTLASSCRTDIQFKSAVRNFTIGRPGNPDAGIDTFHSGMHLWKDARSEADNLRIGKEPYGAYQMDELAVFNRFLGEEEIKAVKDMPLNLALESKSQSRAELFFDYYNSAGTLRVDVRPGLRIPSDAKITVKFLNMDGTPTGISREAVITPGGLEYINLDMKNVKPGKYMVEAEIWCKDKCLAKAAGKIFEKPAPEAWLDNKYGIEDVVLPGFEPLAVRGQEVIVWGRTYDFTNSIMPRQIVNQGTNMLASPIRWTAKINGVSYTLETETMKLISSGPTRAIFGGTGKLGGLKVECKVMVEYDGFMKFDISFNPDAAATKVESLSMEVPLVPAQGVNFYFPCRRLGFWPDAWKSSLSPLCEKGAITLGTPDICLQWLTESDQYYYPKGYNAALETVTTPTEHIFKTNVIAKAKTLKSPIKLTFALQAGPVKPRPAKWRGWTINGRRYLDPEKHVSVNYLYDWWARSPGEAIPRSGFPKAPDPNMYKNEIRMCSMHFAGVRSFDEQDTSKRSPEWALHESEWKRIPVLTEQFDTPGWNEIYVDTNSSWGQWHIANVYKLFEMTGVRGLYYDDWRGGVSMNAAAGSGYVDENGIRYPTYPIFSQRELHRRIYAIVHKFRPKDGIVIIHTANSILLPIVSFCDMIYDGEIMIWTDLIPPKGDYFKTYSDELFQMVFSCRQYGPVAGFHDMTSCSAQREKCGGDIYAIQNQRKLWAKLLLHDIHTQGGFSSNIEELRYLWLDYFGIADSDVVFHPYWSPEPAAKLVKAYWPADGNEEKVSKIWVTAYSKSGKALIIVVRDAPNNYSGNVMVDIKLDRKKLGLPSGALRSMDIEAYCKKELGTVKDDTLTVPAGVDDFTSVVVEKKAEK